MLRMIAGGIAALMLGLAGLFWWQARAGSETLLPPPPAARPIMPLASPNPETPPRASDATREEKRFRRYDKDRDGAVAREEYLASRRKAWAKLDLNGDGALSFDEWAAKTMGKFDGADADKSGRLNAAEFATTRVVRKPRADCPPPPKEDDEG